MLRRMLERAVRGMVLRKTLPGGFRSQPLFVSPEARLTYLFRSLGRVERRRLEWARELVGSGEVTWDIGAQCGVFGFAAAVLAGLVDASLGDAEPLHGAAAGDVAFHDLRHVLDLHPAVPHPFGIHHHGGAVLALVETARGVGPDGLLEAPPIHLLLEAGAQLLGAIGVAGSPGVAGVPLVGADEDVMGVSGHGGNII